MGREENLWRTYHIYYTVTFLNPILFIFTKTISNWFDTFLFLAAEVGYLRKNLKAVMAGKEPKDLYDGYTSCPLILSPKHCILAEFDFQAPPQPLETFPYNQAKPRYVSRVVEYHKKSFEYLKIKFFMPTWWRDCKNMKKKNLTMALWEQTKTGQNIVAKWAGLVVLFKTCSQLQPYLNIFYPAWKYYFPTKKVQTAAETGKFTKVH